MNHVKDFSSHKIPKTGEGLYIITSHKIPRSEVPSTDDMAFQCEIVTDLWLERCLDSRALVSPEAHVTSTPFLKLPIPGELSINPETGFVLTERQALWE